MSGAFWVEIPRDGIEVTGVDAASFLQGQLSQDIEALADGASAWSFLLQPQGKVDAWLRVTRLGEDRLFLDVDGGYGGAVVERLERFKLRTKATLTPVARRCVAVRGVAPPAGGVLQVDAGWPEVVGVDRFGDGPVVPDGIRPGTLDEYEQLRIRAGVPAMGAELTERTIPAEAGAGVIARSVSFTKGCYTGQELVARIDSRGGNVPRHLRGLVVEGSSVDGPAVVSGDPVIVGGAEVGVVTSAAGDVALAFVKRDVEPPVEAVVAGRVARIEALPLLRSGS